MADTILLSGFRAGNWTQQYQYKSFMPAIINIPWQIDDASVQELLSQADRKLGELNAFGSLIPNVDFFITMHIAKEATLSSKIEGTQTNVEEALMKEKDIEPEKRNDWAEVQNYIEAINQAIAQSKTLPVSNRLMKQTHHTLMQGVRGKQKQPGEFRRSQNWIGGASLADAAFIPPHPNDVEELMADLEKFLHNTDLQMPPLLKAAIAHYQFETIHPFLDGNGRLGRLLIVLYLVANAILVKPSLYLSHFFEKNKQLYYDNLTGVRQKNDMVQWLKFFLVGVYETAQNSINTFQQILQLKQTIDAEKLVTLGRKAPTGTAFMQLLYRKPVLDTADVAGELGINIATANRFVTDFEKLGILKEMTGFKRNRIFAFYEYIQLFEN